MRGGVFSKNIWEGAKERASEMNSVRDPKNLLSKLELFVVSKSRCMTVLHFLLYYKNYHSGVFILSYFYLKTYDSSILKTRLISSNS